MPLVGVWHDGAFAFCTGADEQKQRNLDVHPHVAVTTGTTGVGGWDTGGDVVVEGTAMRVTDADALRDLATRGTPSTATTGASRSAATSSSREQLRRRHGGRRAGVPGRGDKAIAFGGDHGQTTYRF